MGMFSWVCKGCGEELVTNEYVRLNDVVCTYDGYGCGMDYRDKVVAWHEFCFQRNALKIAKPVKSPSRYARDQGFGRARLEYKHDYAPKVPVLFKPCVYVGDGPGPFPVLYLTDDGVLDQAAWRYAEKEAYMVLHQKGNPTESEWQDHDDKFFIGKSPEWVAKKFPTLREAVAEADKVVKSMGLKEYDVSVMGEQVIGEHLLTGEVYLDRKVAVFKGNTPTGRYNRSLYVWTRGNLSLRRKA